MEGDATPAWDVRMVNMGCSGKTTENAPVKGGGGIRGGRSVRLACLVTKSKRRVHAPSVHEKNAESVFGTGLAVQVSAEKRLTPTGSRVTWRKRLCIYVAREGWLVQMRRHVEARGNWDAGDDSRALKSSTGIAIRKVDRRPRK